MCQGSQPLPYSLAVGTRWGSCLACKGWGQICAFLLLMSDPFSLVMDGGQVCLLGWSYKILATSCINPLWGLSNLSRSSLAVRLKGEFRAASAKVPALWGWLACAGEARRQIKAEGCACMCVFVRMCRGRRGEWERTMSQ